jgi:PST family polysaccharide transporter
MIWSTKAISIVQIIHLAFIVPILMVSVKYGFAVLYIARSLVRIQVIVVAMIFMRALYKFKVTDVLRNVLPMIVSTAVMGGVGYGLKLVSDSVLWQFVSIFVCIIVYFAVLLGCFPSIRKEILGMDAVNKIIGKLNLRKKA